MFQNKIKKSFKKVKEDIHNTRMMFYSNFNELKNENQNLRLSIKELEYKIKLLENQIIYAR